MLETIGCGLAIALATVAGVIVWARRGVSVTARPAMDRERRLTAFQLVDRSGHAITREDLAGKILAVNFVFTSCSLSCKAVNFEMEKIQTLVRGMDDVVLVSLTVDPRTDTPAVLSRFAAGFHADPDRWLFLTGEKAELYRLIESSFIPRSPELDGLIPGGFANTDRIFLVNRQGKVAASVNGLKRGIAASVVEEISKLRKE